MKGLSNLIAMAAALVFMAGLGAAPVLAQDRMNASDAMSSPDHMSAGGRMRDHGRKKTADRMDDMSGHGPAHQRMKKDGSKTDSMMQSGAMHHDGMPEGQ